MGTDFAVKMPSHKEPTTAQQARPDPREGPEIPDPHLTICVKLVDKRDLFRRRHGDLLGDKVSSTSNWEYWTATPRQQVVGKYLLAVVLLPFHRDAEVGDAVRLRFIEVARADIDLDRGQQQLGHG